MNMKFWKNIGTHLPRINRELVLLFLVILCGIGARFFLLGSVPAGLNQDEASMGYDAYSILEYGIDRNAMHNPVHMIAWGSGQNALQAYVTIPFIKIFGLSIFTIRLVPALFGLLCLLLLYFAARRIAGPVFALLSVFILAICPWHITLSRWALESNMLPGMILLGFLLLLRAQQAQKIPVAAFAVFALAFYAYSTAYAFVPIFLFLYGLYAWRYRIFSIRQWLISLAVFGIVAFPIGLFLLVNFCDLPNLNLYFITIPHLPGAPRYSQMSSFFSADFWNMTLDNFKRVVEILFEKGTDDELQNSVRGVGSLYMLSIPFFFWGLVKCIYDFFREKGPSLRFPLLLWFFVAFAIAGLSTPAVHRMNLVFFPMILLTAYGLWTLWKTKKEAVWIFIFLYLFFFVRFLTLYFNEYARDVGEFFFESYVDAVDYAYDNAAPSDTLYLSDYLNQPYIHVLFITQYDVREYIRTAVIPDKSSSFQIVRSFGRFVFGLDNPASKNANVVVAKNEEVRSFQTEKYYVKPFKYFTVLLRKDHYYLDDRGNPVLGGAPVGY